MWFNLIIFHGNSLRWFLNVGQRAYAFRKSPLIFSLNDYAFLNCSRHARVYYLELGTYPNYTVMRLDFVIFFVSVERFFGKALRCQCISRPQVAENLQLKIQKDNRSSTNVLASNGCELVSLILLQDSVSDHFFLTLAIFISWTIMPRFASSFRA